MVIFLFDLMRTDYAVAGDRNCLETFASANGLVLSMRKKLELLDQSWEEIIIGGGLSEAGASLLEPLKDKLENYVFPQIKNHFSLKKSFIR